MSLARNLIGLGRLSRFSAHGVSRSYGTRSSFLSFNQRYYSTDKQKKQDHVTSRMDQILSSEKPESKSLEKDEQKEQVKETDEDYEEEEEEELSMDLRDLPDRWEKMKADEQQDILEYLNAKQLFAWNYLTKDDKRAIYFISYGSWGPRINAIDSMDGSDAKSKREVPLTTPEFIFRLISSSILFGLVGFSILNYVRDREVIDKIEELEKRQQELSKK